MSVRGRTRAVRFKFGGSEPFNGVERFFGEAADAKTGRVFFGNVAPPTPRTNTPPSNGTVRRNILTGAPIPSDPHGVNSAEKKLFRQYGFDAMLSANTFDQYKATFIAIVQKLAIEHAAFAGEIIAPKNCVAEFWTAQHVHRLSYALKNRRERDAKSALKFWLVATWKGHKLYKQDRNELAQYVETEFMKTFQSKKVKPGAQMKPGTLWKMVERLGLVSERSGTRGPKER